MIIFKSISAKLFRCKHLLLSLFLLWAIPSFAASLLPSPELQFSDQNGKPYVGGKVYMYIPNTNTFKNTWKDAGQTILNTNPITLDGAGRAIVYGTGTYRQILRDALGNTIWDQITADYSTASGYAYAGTSTGTQNAQVINAPNFSSTDGAYLSFLAGFTNTGPMTLNAGGSPIAVLKDTITGPIALTGGEVITGNMVSVIYSSVTGAFHLVAYPFPDSSQPVQSIASASTTNLGSLTSPNVLITGTTTINAFGSSASTSFPNYFIRFNAALTLTNGAALIIPGNANITTASGDYAYVQYQGIGNWKVAAYFRQNGKAVIETDQFPAQAGKASYYLTTNGTVTSWDSKAVTAATTFTGGSGAQFGGNKNVASVVRNSTGNYTLTFTSNLANTNYQTLITIDDTSNMPLWRITGRAVSGFTIVTTLANAVAQDFGNVNVVVIGGL